MVIVLKYKKFLESVKIVSLQSDARRLYGVNPKVPTRPVVSSEDSLYIERASPLSGT